jgi:hypothetical protein
VIVGETKWLVENNFTMIALGGVLAAEYGGLSNQNYSKDFQRIA